MIDNYYYVLDSAGEPLPIDRDDWYRWAKWFEDKEHNQRIVCQEFIGPDQVSTVFLGLDHNYGGKGPPILWETMIFSKEPSLDGFQNRCAGSREQAQAMHKEAVEIVNDFYRKCKLGSESQ